MSTVKKLCQAHCSAIIIFEDGTVYKRNEKEDTLFRAERHVVKMDSVSQPHLFLYYYLKCSWNATAASRVTKRPHDDLDAQWLHIKYVYGHIHATTARLVHNDYKLLNADDAEANVSTHGGNDVTLPVYHPTALRTERDNELPS